MTKAERLRPLDTVVVETPARSATWRMVTQGLPDGGGRGRQGVEF